MDNWRPRFQADQDDTLCVVCFERGFNITLNKLTPNFICNHNGCQNTWADNEALLPAAMAREQARRNDLMETSAAIAQLETGLKNEDEDVEALMTKFYVFNGKWHHTHNLHGVLNRRNFGAEYFAAWIEHQYAAFTRDPVAFAAAGHPLGAHA